MLNFLRQTFLFNMVEDKELSNILNVLSYNEVAYRRGDQVYPTENENCDVGFVLEGKCDVCRIHSDGSKTLLNTLTNGDSFGILSVFSKEVFPTQIFASVNTRILFFSKEQILKFANNSSQISLNIIKFLSDRVAFLNQKLATLSGGTVESRMANYLLCEADKLGSNCLTVNFKKTSDAINAGRASVYRAVASLENAGLIMVNEKKIKILNYKELERISK